jgi:hypothetical protein
MSRRILGSVLLSLLFTGAAPLARALDPDAVAPLDAAAELAPLPGPLQAVRDEDRGALEVLALYQEPLRTALLEVARRPQTLIALERLQGETRKGFRELIEPLPEEERDQLWELVRYPALVESLAGAEGKTPREIEELAREHPEEIRAAALAVSRDHPDLLREIQRLQAGFEAEFETLVRGLDEDGQAAFRAALAHPELLEILSAHMHLSVLLGGAWERDPQGLERALASLANEVAARTASAREDWIRSLEGDPEARAEFEQAAEAYAEAEEIDYADETRTREETRVALLVYPYPYWFGFPGAYYGFYYGFYPYAGYWWYPYHHHHFGFYYGPRHRIVVYGFPSHYFLSWYFGSGSHHEHYPHLSRHFARHRGIHRYSHDRVSHHVERWERGSRPRQDRLWDRGPRVARLREAGPLARTTRQRARERPESRSIWRWLRQDPGRDRSSRSAREAAPSARPESRSSGRRVRQDRGRDRSSHSAREAAPSARPESRSSGRRVRQDRGRDHSSHSAKRDAGRAPRASERRGVGSRERPRAQATRPSRGRSARAMAPHLDTSSRQRGVQRQGSPGHGRSKLTGRGGPRPRAKGPGGRGR